jgi:hypothetical protein
MDHKTNNSFFLKIRIPEYFSRFSFSYNKLGIEASFPLQTLMNYSDSFAARPQQPAFCYPQPR